MGKVIIGLSNKFNINWNLIYKFIKKCNRQGAPEDFNENDFTALLDSKVRLAFSNKEDNKAVVSLELEGESIVDYQFIKDRVVCQEHQRNQFYIIYKLEGPNKDYHDLISFILFREKCYHYNVASLNEDGTDSIRFGIYAHEYQGKEYDELYFRYSAILQLFINKTDTANIAGVYFIKKNTKTFVDPKTGEKLHSLYSVNLAKAPKKGSSYSQISMRFIPLMKVSEKSFGIFKESVQNTNNHLTSYINDSINKIIDGCKIRDVSLLVSQSSSLFEKWFILSFYNAYWSETNKDRGKKPTDDDKSEVKFKEYTPTLHSYFLNIYELVQNIIFHTDEKEGLLFIRFIKEKANWHLMIGIYDYSETGIVDSFRKHNNLGDNINLLTFIDPKELLPVLEVENPKSPDYLSYRYAAHLGIKSFASSVARHQGTFSVESNCGTRKEGVKYLGTTFGQFSPAEGFVSGTHYIISLPVKALDTSPTISIPIQNESVSDLLLEDIKRPFIIHIFENEWIKDIDKVNTKKEQSDIIKEAGNKLLQYFDRVKSKNGAYGVDMVNTSGIKSNVLIKLLSYILLNNPAEIKTLILVNLNATLLNDFCNVVNNLCELNKSGKPIWSRDNALILNSGMRTQIFCGETRNELYFANQVINHIYFSNNQDKNNNIFPRLDKEKEKELDQIFCKFINSLIFPYECLGNGFKEDVKTILETKIDADEIGCKTPTATRIGSKMYINKFYEADFLFQNSYFTDRFAFLIVKDIYKKVKSGKFILIGHKTYSELLVKKVKYFLDKLYNCEGNGNIVESIIATEDNNGDIVFVNSNEIFNRLEGQKYTCVTIVPIASTLSTNDKIIAYFKKRIPENTGINYLNYCSILVRDSKPKEPGESITNIEKQFKWIRLTDNMVETEFQNAKSINYALAVEGEWHNLIDLKTYPNNFAEEEYINKSHNSSLNLLNNFRYPNAALPQKNDIDDELCYFNNDLIFPKYRTYQDLMDERINDMREYIYYGHIIHNESHHRYYFDTEGYIKDSNKSFFKMWLSYLKESLQETQKHSSIYNILIFPDNESESDFANQINDIVFNGNAFIICLRINNPRQNIKTKLSYLKKIYEKDVDKIHFHYIDHALLTGESYRKSLRYIQSIINSSVIFDDIYTIVNRLSEEKYNDIIKGPEAIYSYIHFYVLPYKSFETTCSLCELNGYYTELANYTAIPGCLEVIANNAEKFVEKKFNEVPIEKISNNKRAYLRLKFRNRIFYEIASITKQKNINLRKDEINNKFDEIFNAECRNNNGMIDYDAIISFLKAITFPPLSQYVNISEYAHKKALMELNFVLNTKKPGIDDLCLLEALLKSLSWFDSNALVRKEVIENSWKLFFKVYHRIEKENKKLNERIDIIKDRLEIINSKERITKQSKISDEYSLFPDIDSIYSDEKTKLLDELNELKEKVKCNHDVLSEFDNKYLFYIKNSTFDDEAKSLWLEVLLRTGKEPKIDSFIDYSIPITMFENDIICNPFNSFAKDLYYDIEHEHQIILVQKYRDFINNAFFDNTTILRKALDNFENEANKDKSLKNLVNKFPESRTETIKKYHTIVNREYYYSWFRDYLMKCVPEEKDLDAVSFDESQKDVHLIEKLCYLLNTRLFIKAPLQSSDNTINLHNNAVGLLNRLIKIVSAKGAYATVLYKSTQKVIAYTSNLSDSDFRNDKNEKLFMQQFNDDELNSPIVFCSDLSRFREKYMLNGSITNTIHFIVRLTNRTAKRNNQDKVVFSFLYDSSNEYFDLTQTERRENSRLLLLLVPEIINIFNHIIDSKIYDIWIKDNEQIDAVKKRFKRVYLDDNHSFSPDSWSFKNSLLWGEQEVDSEKKKSIVFNNTLILSNMVVKDLFAHITHYNTIQKTAPSKEYSIFDIFDEHFLSLLHLLYENNNAEGYNLSYKEIFDKNDPNFKGFGIKVHIPIIQGCLIQCFENAVKKCRLNNYSDHRKIELSISYHDGNIIIQLKNSISSGHTDLENAIGRFKEKYNPDTINKLTAEETSDKYRFTLISLIRYCESVGFGWEANFCNYEKNSSSPEFYVKIIIPKTI